MHREIRCVHTVHLTKSAGAAIPDLKSNYRRNPVRNVRNPQLLIQSAEAATDGSAIFQSNLWCLSGAPPVAAASKCGDVMGPRLRTHYTQYNIYNCTDRSTAHGTILKNIL